MRQNIHQQHQQPPGSADQGLNLLAVALVIGILAILFRKVMAAMGDVEEGSRDLEWSL